MRRFFYILVAIHFCCVNAAALDDKNVRVVEKQDADTIELWADSTGNLDFTITVTATLENMTSSPKLPLTIDSAGRQKFLLVALQHSRGPWQWKYHYNWKPGGRSNGQQMDNIFLLPFQGTFKVMQGFLGKFSHYQGSQSEYAVDWAMPEGTTVCAARGGLVTGVRQDSNEGGSAARFLHCDNYVIIRHEDGTYAEYRHLKQNGALVKLGQKVAAREPIALSGNTGYSTASHLHFAVFNTIDGTRKATIPIRFRIQNGDVIVPKRGELDQ